MNYSTNSNKEESKETNINVVVRVRPRNSKEIKENSPVWISSKSNKEIQVKTENSGVMKQYTFDKVFGPEDQQEHIFDQVVSPMLSEVLTGYNCTIFAYGQTGAGKTYTMEGDLVNIQYSGAGIIPRTLFQLFKSLEADKSEFSVKVSYIELYNEELKDLLSEEDDPRRLRIFEDNNRKGSVVIQGLEEAIVKNAMDVINILQKGSMKRQIAATKMNEMSSRSHCIFSITVHIKEATPDGEELLKVGKLNLVDLAGSENIGRSGAENKRAKEAGMINQSLLTLGRVINALVERSPHIPYRESKLTRLLQDSLGGKTKTCIIAAVSPAKCNLDESLSTLDYAHRAKNIRNKPEINQKMTKRALIREYVHEIERLKSDLLATREKNGVYLSSESYTALVDENEGRKTRIEEISREILAKEDLIKQNEMKFKELSQLLDSSNAKLDVAMTELEEKKAELLELIEQVKKIEQKLVEQQILTKAHAHTENKLNRIASGLFESLKENISDVDALHGNLDRREVLEKSNQDRFKHLKEALQSHSKTIQHASTNFGQQSSGFFKQSTKQIETMEQVLKKFVVTTEETFHAEMILLDHEQKVSHETVAAFADDYQKHVQSLHNNLKHLESQLLNARESSQKSFESALNILRSDIKTHEQKMKFWQTELTSKVDNLFELICKIVENSAVTRKTAVELVAQTTQEEISKLRSEKQELMTLLKEERSKTSMMKQRAIEQFTTLMQDLEHDSNQCFESVETTLMTSSMRQERKWEYVSSSLIDVVKEGGEHESALIEESEELETSMDSELRCGVEISSSLLTLAETHISSMAELSKDLQSSESSILRKEKESLECVVSNMDERKTSFVAENTKESKKIRLMIKEVGQVMDDQMADIKHQLNTECENLSKVLGQKKFVTNQYLDHVKENAYHSLAEIEAHKVIEYSPSGKTPRRKKVKLPSPWVLTKKHDEILDEYRKNGHVELPEMPPSPTPGKRASILVSLTDDLNDSTLSQFSQSTGLNHATIMSKLPRMKFTKPSMNVHEPFSPLQESVDISEESISLPPTA